MSMPLALAAWERHRHLCVTYRDIKVPSFGHVHRLTHDLPSENSTHLLRSLSSPFPKWTSKPGPSKSTLNDQKLLSPFYHRQHQTWFQPSQLWAVLSLLTLCQPESIPASFPILLIQQGSWSCSWNLAMALSHAKQGVDFILLNKYFIEIQRNKRNLIHEIYVYLNDSQHNLFQLNIYFKIFLGLKTSTYSSVSLQIITSQM